ncbi:MAG: hypothetical protein P8N46_04245, partial [Flavobacteriales bacterium]|nr:hypothetical protein [Flavobacteriales bacterium]
MKPLFLPIYLILLLSSCFTSNNQYHYSDPNYLSNSDFSTYEELTENTELEEKIYISDTISDDYLANDYYDYSYSSRIRRFHRPLLNSGYYGSMYTDYYWYNNDPFYCGTSIYYGYNWHSPFYSYYSYSPFYYNHYSPYYYGNYFTASQYGHYQYLNTNYNSNNYDSYLSGNRGNLTSNTSVRTITNNSNYITNNIKKNSTINIRSNSQKNSEIRINTNKTPVVKSNNNLNNSSFKDKFQKNIKTT